MRYHFIPIRMATIKQNNKPQKISVGEDVEPLGIVIGNGECKKQCGGSSKN